MDNKIAAIAERLSALRDICEVSAEDMAKTLKITPAEYLGYERGEREFNISFLCEAADMLGVEMIDLLTGESARLTLYSLVKAGQGLSMERRKEYQYQHLAYVFKDKHFEPFLVKVAPNDIDATTHLKTHSGQEFNYILDGSMWCYIADEQVLLEPGDSLFFDSKHPHAMKADGDKPCTFIAIVTK